MNTLSKQVTALNELVSQFDYETAHQHFYANHLVKHENEGAPTIGLEAHKEEMKVFLASINEPHAELLSTIVLEDISIGHWHYKFNHQQWGQRDFRQISIQRWKAGKVVHERHLYKTYT